jgi:hypothetical protein
MPAGCQEKASVLRRGCAERSMRVGPSGHTPFSSDQLAIPGNPRKEFFPFASADKTAGHHTAARLVAPGEANQARPNGSMPGRPITDTTVDGSEAPPCLALQQWRRIDKVPALQPEPGESPGRSPTVSAMSDSQ